MCVFHARKWSDFVLAREFDEKEVDDFSVKRSYLLCSTCSVGVQPSFGAALPPRQATASDHSFSLRRGALSDPLQRHPDLRGYESAGVSQCCEGHV